MNRSTKALILGFAVGLVSLSSPAGASDDSQRIQDLEQQVADLTRIVQDLQADAVRSAAADPAGPGPSLGDGPDLSVSMFGDFNYSYRDRDTLVGPNARANEFALGDFAIFLSSRLTDRVSFFSEIAFEFEDGGVHVDMERIIASLELHERLDLNVGRGHTSLSHWNRTYHHGSYLQTTIATPLILGKLLPRHFVGVEFAGNLPTDHGLATATLTVANGRGVLQGREQNTFDGDQGKFQSLVLGYQAAWLPGLQLSLGYTRDEIPADAALLGRARGMDEQIGSAAIVYDAHAWELLMEGHWVRHDDHVDRERKESHGRLRPARTALRGLHALLPIRVARDRRRRPVLLGAGLTSPYRGAPL